MGMERTVGVCAVNDSDSLEMMCGTNPEGRNSQMELKDDCIEVESDGFLRWSAFCTRE